MTPFRKLTESVFASPQIEISDVAAAKDQGITLIVNNRPDGEDPNSPQGADIAAAAEASGVAYVAIPIGHSGFSEPQVEEMIAAMDGTDGKILAYCRSGTRSTFLWSLAQAKRGRDPDQIAADAMAAGYDIRAIRPMIDMLAAR